MDAREYLNLARKRGFSVSELVDRTGYSSVAIRTWTNGSKIPSEKSDKDISERIASFIDEKPRTEQVVERLRKVIKKGISQRQISSITGIGTSSINDWVNARRVPDYKSTKNVWGWLEILESIECAEDIPFVMLDRLNELIELKSEDRGLVAGRLGMTSEEFEQISSGHRCPKPTIAVPLKREINRLRKMPDRSEPKVEKPKPEIKGECRFFEVPRECRFCGSSRIRSKGLWCFKKGYNPELCNEFKRAIDPWNGL